MTLQEFLAIYTVSDPAGGRLLKVSTTGGVDDPENYMTISDPAGGRALKVSLAGGGGGVPTSRTLTINGVTYDLSADRSWTVAAGAVNWSEGFSSATQATSRWTPNNAAANVNAAITPKGTGALVAQTPDGTTTGGNARGTYAVDWQMTRSNANQVASGGYTVIGGGYNNRNTGWTGVIGGGGDNFIATNNTGGDTIGGGFNNSINSSNGNSTIGGGALNTILSFQQDSVIGGGRQNQINTRTSVIGGGASNIIYTNYTTIGGGVLNVGAGDYSTVIGGFENVTQAPYSAALGGWKVNAYFYGQKAHSNGMFGAIGDAQGSEVMARAFGPFTTATTVEIFLDGASQRISPPTNGTMTVNVDLVAVVTSIAGTATGMAVGDMFSQNSICAFKNAGGTGTVVQSFNIMKAHSGSMNNCDTVFTATGSSLQVKFTGPTFAGGGVVNMRVVAKIRITETIY